VASAYSNAYELASDMAGAARQGLEDAKRITRHYGMLLETQIKANVYHWTPPQQPMRHKRTGAYRRSWTTRHASAGGVSTATVGTNAPQARRLEYGFSGPDRLGRVYDDPPRPHVGPAADEWFPKYVDALRDIPSLGG
jgi:hypothetical protein